MIRFEEGIRSSWLKQCTQVSSIGGSWIFLTSNKSEHDSQVLPEVWL